MNRWAAWGWSLGERIRMRKYLRIGSRALLASGFVGVSMVGASLSGVSAATRSSKAPSRVELAGGTQITRPTATADRETLQGDEALKLVSYPWQTMLPGWRIVFLPPRPGFLALTYRLDHRIEVYVRSDRSAEALAHDIAHELGHAVDVTYNNDQSRSTYRQLRSMSDTTQWWACNSCTDLQTLAGDFAETFALYAAPRYKFYGKVAPEPTPAEVNVIARQVYAAVGAVGAA